MASKNELAAIIAVFPWKNRVSGWAGGPRAGSLGWKHLPVAAGTARGWAEVVRGRGRGTARDYPHVPRWGVLLQACTPSDLASLAKRGSAFNLNDSNRSPANAGNRMAVWLVVGQSRRPGEC